PELLAALAFVLAARLVRHGRAASLAELAGASACVGMLPWLSTRAWLIAIGVGLVVAYCALRPLQRTSAAGLVGRVAAGAGPFALGWLVYFVYVADIAYWWADGSPPSRYLVASIPFLTVLLAAGIERIEALGRWRPLAESAAWALAAYSLFIAYVFAVLPNVR